MVALGMASERGGEVDQADVHAIDGGPPTTPLENEGGPLPPVLPLAALLQLLEFAGEQDRQVERIATPPEVVVPPDDPKRPIAAVFSIVWQNDSLPVGARLLSSANQDQRDPRYADDDGYTANLFASMKLLGLGDDGQHELEFTGSVFEMLTERRGGARVAPDEVARRQDVRRFTAVLRKRNPAGSGVGVGAGTQLIGDQGFHRLQANFHKATGGGRSYERLQNTYASQGVQVVPIICLEAGWQHRLAGNDKAGLDVRATASTEVPIFANGIARLQADVGLIAKIQTWAAMGVRLRYNHIELPRSADFLPSGPGVAWQTHLDLQLGRFGLGTEMNMPIADKRGVGEPMYTVALRYRFGGGKKE